MDYSPVYKPIQVCSLGGDRFLVESEAADHLMLFSIEHCCTIHMPRDRFERDYRGPRVTLPYDMRQWDPDVRRAWVYRAVHDGTQKVPRGYSRRIEKAIFQVRRLRENNTLEHNTDRFNQVIAAVRGEMGRATPSEPEPLKALRSRRVKQNRARRRKATVSAPLKSAPKSKATTADRLARPVATYPKRPFRWPVRNGARLVSEWLARTDQRNSKGEQFVRWYENEGRFLDCHQPDDYYKLWLGIDATINLGLTEEEDNKFYLSCPRLTDGPNAPKPPNWPFSYEGRLGTKEELDALQGIMIQEETFLTWYDLEPRVPMCRGRQHPVQVYTRCRDCAQLIYRRWRRQ